MAKASLPLETIRSSTAVTAKHGRADVTQPVDFQPMSDADKEATLVKKLRL